MENANTVNLENIDVYDHDLLIKHSVKLDSVCAVLKDIKKDSARREEKLDKLHLEMFGKIDAKVDSNIFRWIVSILIVIVMTLFGVVGTSKLDTVSNTSSINRLNSFHAISKGGNNGEVD